MTLTFVKPRGGEGQNGQLKCPLGFLVLYKVVLTSDYVDVILKMIPSK